MFGYLAKGATTTQSTEEDSPRLIFIHEEFIQNRKKNAMKYRTQIYSIVSNSKKKMVEKKPRTS